MNDTIIYRPFKNQGWPLFLTVPVGMLAFFAAGVSLPYQTVGTIVLAAMGLGSAWLTKRLCDLYHMAVLFEQDGVRIVGGNSKNCRYIPWKEVSYAYYVRNFKGRQYLVLSPDALSTKEAKKMANRSVKSSAIYVDFSQNTTQIKERIAQNVPYVDVCKI